MSPKPNTIKVVTLICLLLATTAAQSGYVWAAQQGVFKQAAASPAPPLLNNPADGAIDVSTFPTLEATLFDGDGDELTVTFYGREKSNEPVPPDFTIAVLPDTQKYVCGDKCGADPATFVTQTQWIYDNQAAENIIYVTHVGDIVEHGSYSNNKVEWERAETALHILEQPLLPDYPEGIPYGVAVGNHDQGSGFTNPGKTQLFNQYFGIERFNGRAYYGDHYDTTNNQYYTLFSYGGLDFVMLYLEFDPTPSQDVLDWADTVLKTYPDRRAIVTSHFLLTGAGEFSNQGLKIFNKLKDNPNLFLMVSGHDRGEAVRTEIVDGRKIHIIFANFQDWVNGGDGWMRLMRFSPASNEIFVETYSPTLNEYQHDADSEFTLKADLQQNAFTVIKALDFVPAESTASVVWADLQPMTAYEWYVEVSDGIHIITSPLSSFTTTATPQPTPTPAPSCLIVLDPTADSYIRSGDEANHNFGSETQLAVKAGGDNFTRKSFLKFDLSLLEPAAVQTAHLQVFVQEVQGSAPTPLFVYGLNSAAHWNEQTITWNNQPAGGSMISQNTAVEGEWITFNVTDYVNIKAGNPAVSFMLFDDQEANLKVDINSRESTLYPPRLEIETTCVAESSVTPTSTPVATPVILPTPTTLPLDN